MSKTGTDDTYVLPGSGQSESNFFLVSLALSVKSVVVLGLVGAVASEKHFLQQNGSRFSQKEIPDEWKY